MLRGSSLEECQMRKLGFAPLAVLFVVLTAAGPKLPVTVEHPAAAPAFAQETPLACPAAVDPTLGDIFGPPSYGCHVDSDCFNYCCITYGACGGDSQCSPRGTCLC